MTLNRIQFFLIIAAIATLLLLFYQKQRYKVLYENKTATAETLQRIMESRSSTLNYYRGKHDNQVATNQALALELSALKELLQEDRFHFIEEVEGLRKNLKNLEQVITINANVNSKFTTPLIDSTASISVFRYETPFLKSRGIVTDSTLVMDELLVVVPIHGVILWQRKHLKLFGQRRSWLPRWGRKEYKNHFYSTNPDVNLTGIENIKILKR